MTPPDPRDCRICRDAAEPLLQPCRCASYVHQSCLKQWTSTRVAATFPLTFSAAPPSCEVCLAPYEAKNDASSAPSQPSPSLCGCPGPPWSTSDPLSLLPPHAACSAIVTLEMCVLLCLFMLSVSGHTIFLIRLYTPTPTTPGVEEFAAQRVLLAVLNACLTFGVLFLVRKIVARWLRDSPPPLSLSGSFAASPSGAPPPLPPPATSASSAAALAPQGGGAPAGRVVGHFTLGAFLSCVAGAEVFLLISAL